MIKLTDYDKGLIAVLISKIYKNVTTGEMSQERATDESLIFAFDEETLKHLERIYNKFSKEYQI